MHKESIASHVTLIFFSVVNRKFEFIFVEPTDEMNINGILSTSVTGSYLQ